MAQHHPDRDVLAELEALGAAIPLSFPIATKEDFVAQMTAMTPTVTFAGTHYDTAFGARLIPRFFFPLDDRDDLLLKVRELLTARGLLGENPTHVS